MSSNSKYDRHLVVQKAMELYWKKGFHGTSMRNLQEVVDMRPGSIYATFGSKEALYKESIQYYAESGLAQLKDFCERSESPLVALKMFIKSVVIEDSESVPSGMCMLVKTISELTEENNELLNETKHLLNVMETAFGDVLVQAQNCGEIDASKDIADLARNTQIQLMGLRTYVRSSNMDKLQIDSFIDHFFTKTFG